MPSPAAGDDAGLTDPLLANGGGTGRCCAGAGGKDKRKYWVPADEEDTVADMEEGGGGGRGGEDGRRPLLYRTFKVKGILLHPYRYVVLGAVLIGNNAESNFAVNCIAFSVVAANKFQELTRSLGLN
jgi:1,4-beta-D-xylan synthase